MKVIIDLSEQEIKDLNEIAQVNGETYSEILMPLFYNQFFNPATDLGNIILNDKQEDFDNFRELLGYYLHEAIRDIEVSSKSEESYITDKAMVHVFRRLLHNHLDNIKITTDLYKTFRKNFKGKIT